jgi:dihydrofolate reductase
LIISLIVAMDESGGIGKNNRLVWHLRTDLKRFKEITMGHVLVMGRKTWETIGKPLPGRTMVIISRNRDYRVDGCIVVHSLEDAIGYARKLGEIEVFIIGGGEIFKQALNIADIIYLTRVHTVVNADVFFPKLDQSEWEISHREKFPQSDQDDYASEFQVLIRRQ